MLTFPAYRFDAGDRFPDGPVQDPMGGANPLYHLLPAGALAVYWLPAGVDVKQVLSTLEENLAKHRELGVTPLVLTAQDAGANAALLSRRGGNVMLLADQSGRLSKALQTPRKLPVSPNLPLIQTESQAAERAAGAVFLLDRNQRIAAIATAQARDGQGLVTELLKIAEARSDRLALELHPPVLSIPEIISPELCRDLIALWNSGHEEGLVGTDFAADGSYNVRKTNRKTRDHFIRDPQLNQAMVDLVGMRLANEVAKAFQFRIANFEPFYIVCYDADRQDFFGPHRDNTNRAFAHRRFAVTIHLNHGDYEGGGVRFPEHSYYVSDAQPGSATVFSCSLLHEALPVTKGQRYILSGFMWGKEKVG